MKTIGIGSLPHHSTHDAINFSFRHTMPFLPQMTSLGERMIAQALSSEHLTKKYIALESFTEKILKNKINNFKIQIAGPETCSASSKIILNEINLFLKYFNQYNLYPVIFIDEPVLKKNTTQLKNIYDELSKLNITSGLHSCAKFDWHQIRDLELDYLSFDSGIMSPPKEFQNHLIVGIPPFSKHIAGLTGEWISSSCGLATFSEDECDSILKNLESYK